MSCTRCDELLSELGRSSQRCDELTADLARARDTVDVLTWEREHAVRSYHRVREGIAELLSEWRPRPEVVQ